MRYRVQISFYDTLTGTFFGRTWASPLYPFNPATGTSLQQQVLYFRTSLYSEYCVAIVEYVLVVIRKEPGTAPNASSSSSSSSSASSSSSSSDDEVVIDRYGIGWTILTLFSRDLQTLTDVNDPVIDLSESASQIDHFYTSSLDINASTAAVAANQQQRLKRTQKQKKLWAGTPRVMMFFEAINFTAAQQEWQRKLTHAVGIGAIDPNARRSSGGGGDGEPNQSSGHITLYYEIFLCKALQPFFHLFRENEILGSRDFLSGLPLITPLTNPLSLRSKLGVRLGACLPQNPKLLSQVFLPLFQMKIRNPTLSLPPDFERSFKQEMSSIKAYQWSGVSTSVEILSRTLVVGIHNGRKYIRQASKLPLNLVGNEPMMQQHSDQQSQEESQLARERET